MPLCWSLRVPQQQQQQQEVEEEEEEVQVQAVQNKQIEGPCHVLCDFEDADPNVSQKM